MRESFRFLYIVKERKKGIRTSFSRVKKFQWDERIFSSFSRVKKSQWDERIFYQVLYLFRVKVLSFQGKSFHTPCTSFYREGLFFTEFLQGEASPDFPRKDTVKDKKTYSEKPLPFLEKEKKGEVFPGRLLSYPLMIFSGKVFSGKAFSGKVFPAKAFPGRSFSGVIGSGLSCIFYRFFVSFNIIVKRDTYVFLLAFFYLPGLSFPGLSL